MDRLLALYSQQNTHSTPAEMCRNYLLDLLKSGEEGSIRWRNLDALEFEITNEMDLKRRFYVRTGKDFNRVLNEGTRFFRKVHGLDNVYRFHFVPRHLRPLIPNKKFAQRLMFSTETAV
ncbi:hypothetical protein B9Z55_014351 [Caenorhabditis nigoni]|uniref:ETS domain-containing protein n=1 Tax=Caenorhabditis nigoni TaxID=1611254 RepID=A0A2G5U5Q4_9PELO|nr:hypothetical protein B9Z55_014351 [Caenorhabditis nigoni]